MGGQLCFQYQQNRVTTGHISIIVFSNLHQIHISTPNQHNVEIN